MNYKQKIFVAGSSGMVGSSLVRQLNKKGYSNILTHSRKELNLVDQLAVRNFFEIHKPDQVYLAAAKVGGIHANNSYPADFIYDNLMIEANVIHEAFKAGVKKILFLGSSCVYPKFAEQPILEKELLNGYLESTNEPYAIAKIAGIKLCESYNRQFSQSHEIDYRCVMPTNLYGPGDNYHPENSHVIPGLIRRFHESKIGNLPSVKVWGTGLPCREFLYVDDMASGSMHVMNLSKNDYINNTSVMQSHINIGYGSDITVYDLALLIKKVVGYEGDILLDKDKSDGTPKKILDSSKLNSLGWSPEYDLEEGLKLTYESFIKSYDVLRES